MVSNAISHQFTEQMGEQGTEPPSELQQSRASQYPEPTIQSPRPPNSPLKLNAADHQDKKGPAQNPEHNASVLLSPGEEQELVGITRHYVQS